MREEVREIRERMRELGYVAGREVATALHLSLSLGKPLLVEGEAGVGKTEIAKVLARMLDAELIRLQCYEGLDVHSALYEWNYQKQLLRIRMEESAGNGGEMEDRIFGRDCLLERPLLAAISREEPPVLLIDEIDRADEEFEAFLLELLSDFQVSIPELGTVRAVARPNVVLTSNETRELSDALRRRCLYLWIDYPSPEKELEILRARVPALEAAMDRQVVDFVQELRGERLYKTPGVAETIDWAEALVALQVEALDAAVVRETLGCLVKDRHDLAALSADGLERMVERARGAVGADRDGG